MLHCTSTSTIRFLLLLPTVNKLLPLVACILLVACEVPVARVHGIAPFSMTKALPGMTASETAELQPAAKLRPGAGLSETIGEYDVLYAFDSTSATEVPPSARMSSLSFMQLLGEDPKAATSAWATAVSEMRALLGSAPRRCGTILYARATATVATWSEGTDEVLVYLLNDGEANRLFHSWKMGADSTSLTPIDCP